MRHAWVDVDLDAIAHNTSVLARRAAPAALCAVVKADAYGHGAVSVARTALDAGASLLAVAIVEEGIELRHAGIEAEILVLSEAPLDALDDVVAHRLTPTVYRPESIRAAQTAATDADTRLGVHLKIDTGMRRVGADPTHTRHLIEQVVEADHLDVAGLFTHLAVADEPDNPFTFDQLERFEATRRELVASGLPTGAVHVANSAALLRGLGERFPHLWDVVRAGISLYGLAPSSAITDDVGLRPAMSLRARASYVKRISAGEGVSYGLRYRPGVDTQIVTVPLGYADGVTRVLSQRGAEVLIDGRRHPIVGTITMDQILVDTGPEGTVEVGDEVVLLGRQGSDEITAGEWAERLDTITYEIVCGFTRRLPRRHLPRGQMRGHG